MASSKWPSVHDASPGGAKRLRPADGWALVDDGVEESTHVVPRAQMLRADVPVEPEVSAHLHTELSRLGVSVLGPAQKEVESRPEICIFEDASLDRPLLIGPFDPASDVGGHDGEVSRVPEPDEIGFPGCVQLFERILLRTAKNCPRYLVRVAEEAPGRNVRARPALVERRLSVGRQ